MTTRNLSLDGIVKNNLEYKWNKVKSVTVEDINLPDFRLINVTTSESVSIYDESNFFFSFTS